MVARYHMRLDWAGSSSEGLALFCLTKTVSTMFENEIANIIFAVIFVGVALSGIIDYVNYKYGDKK
jgi:hypothetical protein